MLKLRFAFLFFLIAIGIKGQNTISGTVTDKQSGEALPGVNVYIEELSKGTVTDIRGRYVLKNLPEKELFIRFSFIGYQTVVKKVKIGHKNPELDVEMETMVIQGQEVVVSGNFTGTQHQSTIKINTISAQYLAQSAQTSLVAALAKVPGVDLISNGPGIGTPVIRGLSTSNILFLNNGIPLQNYQFSPDHPYMVDETGIEKIEIIKGPASLIYGSGAVGGVVNLIPEPVAPENSTSGNLELRYASNTAGLQSNIGVKGNRNGWVWGLHGSVNSNRDFIQGNGMTAPNTRFNRYAFKARAGNVGKNGSFRLFYDYNRDKIGIANEFSIISESGNSRENRVWYQELENHLLISKNLFYIGDFKMNFDAGYQFNHRKLNGSEQTPAFTLVDMTLQTLSWNLKSTYAFTEKTKITFGIQGMGQQNKNFDAPNRILPDATAFDLSGYALVRAGLGQRFILEGGLRYSFKKLNVPVQGTGQTGDDGKEVVIRYNGYFSNLSASLGNTIKLAEKFFMRINLSSAFRNPNLAELTQYGMHETRFEVGDTNLVPQQNLEGDLGFHYHSKHITFDLDGFYNFIDHYITLSPTPDTTDNGMTVYRYIQTNARIFGGEAAVHFHPHPLDWLHIEANWQLAIGEQREGGYLPFVPAQKFKFEVKLQQHSWKFFRNLYLSAGTDVVSDQNRPSEFEERTPGYTLVDLGAGFIIELKKQQIGFSFSVSNLFDIAYHDHLSLLWENGLYNPGRNFVLNLNIPF